MQPREVGKTGAGLSATAIDAEAAQTKMFKEQLLNDFEEATYLIATTSLNSLSRLFLANGRIMHRSAATTARYGDSLRRWTYAKAAEIKQTHNGWSHWINMTSGVGQAVFSGICMGKQFQIGQSGISEAAKKMAYKLNSNQLEASRSFGQMGQTVGGYFASGDEAARTEHQVAQNAMVSDHQQGNQDTGKQQALDALRKAGEVGSQNHGAFGEFAR